jgi:hypothetical protein
LPPTWTVPVFAEPESVTPRRGIAFALTILASIMHLGAGVILALLGAAVGMGSERLLGALQVLFGLIAAVCAYRIWERDVSGPWIAIQLGVAAVALTLVVGLDLPIFVKAGLLLPAALEVVGGVAVLRVPRPE